MRNVLLIFIDGLGLGENNPASNPLAQDNITLGSECRLYQQANFTSARATVIPTDACLGVPGYPQSATGQTTLLTGINAAAALGYHKSAYPNEALIKILKHHSIFVQCQQQQLSATFANAFRQEYWTLIKKNKRKHSATTLATLSGGSALRYEEDYEQGQAVFHDITGHFLRALGRPIPYLSPIEAGRRLAAISRQHQFTLFEYFMTDFLGHRKQMLPILKLFNDLELFINTIIANLDLDNTAVIIASDHGNVEDLSTSAHTYNPVPTILIGPLAKTLTDQISNLTHIVPAIMSLLTRK